MGRLTYALLAGRGNPFKSGLPAALTETQSDLLNSVEFVITTDPDHPEAQYRFTFFRKRVEFGRNGRVIDEKPGLYTIQLSERVIVEYPTIVERAERFLGEMLWDEFDFTLYDSCTPSDILDSGGHPITLSPINNNKLLTTWMRPVREVDLYCRIEIRENGNDYFEEMVTGVMKSAMGGKNIMLEHEQDHNIYLNGTDNREYHTERTFDLKFIPVQMNGIARVPNKPTKNVGSGYDFTFWTPTNGVTPDYAKLAEAGTTRILPVVAATPNTAATYRNTSNQQVALRWNRHIDAYEWLKKVFNHAYGEGLWVFTCDDSPIKFWMAGLRENMEGIVDGAFTEVFEHPVNVSADQPLNRRLLLPMALWGLHDDLDDDNDANDPHPILHGSWEKRSRSAWEQIMELCLFCGWIPLIDWDRSFNPPKVKIHFQNRETYQRGYDTLVPFASSNEVFYEAELGVSVQRPKLFRNADEAQGWNDDWYATRNGPDCLDTVTMPQANPYVVPATAESPAKITMSLTFGGISNGQRFVDQGALDTIPIGWYSTCYHTPQQNAFPNVVWISQPVTTANFPSTTPLISAGFIQPPDPTMDPAIHQAGIFGPIIGGSFSYTKSDQSRERRTSSTVRQLLARYYATFFVRSDSKFRADYGTITQFTNPEDGTRSWKNVKPFFTTNVAVVEADTNILITHWTKTVTRKTRANETEVETQQISRVSPFFDSSWKDETMERGNVSGRAPDEDAGPRESKIA
jgi:hypothetical protein